MYYIYMVRCADDSIYTGIAADLKRRLRQHVEKDPAAAKYTRSRVVTALEAAWTAPDRSTASRLESAIKRLPRAKKLELIADPEQFSQLLSALDGASYVRLPAMSLESCLKGETT